MKNLMKKISIEKDKNGFIVWITEDSGEKHWILDGSIIEKDGRIHLSNYDGYETKVEYDEENNCLQFINKKL